MPVWTVNMEDAASIARGTMPAGAVMARILRPSYLSDTTFPVGVQCPGDSRVSYAAFERCMACRAKCRPRMCGWCYSVGYCGRGCQSADWASHRPVCRQVAEQATRLVKSFMEIGTGAVDGRDLLYEAAKKDALVSRFLSRCNRLDG